MFCSSSTNYIKYCNNYVLVRNGPNEAAIYFIACTERSLFLASSFLKSSINETTYDFFFIIFFLFDYYFLFNFQFLSYMKLLQISKILKLYFYYHFIKTKNNLPFSKVKEMFIRIKSKFIFFDLSFFFPDIKISISFRKIFSLNKLTINKDFIFRLIIH